MGSFLIILNPTAGRGAGLQRAGHVCDLLRAAGQRAEIKTTAAPGDAYRLALGAVQEGAAVVVGAGGDGTLQEISRALQSTDTALGIIPAGCCNDFGHAVGVFRSDSAERLAGILLEGRPRAVDLGRVGSHRFLTVATFGFASAVSRLIEKRRTGSRGTLAYLGGILRLLRRYRAAPVVLRGDFGERSGRCFTAAVGNTRTCAGRLPITPGADCGDGLFQVCLLDDVSRLTVLALLGPLFRGTHLRHPAVRALNTRFLEIETTAEPGWICADGESLCQTPCRLEIAPGALRVMTPGAA
jgi:diacylglycerol kinase (ATP)